MACTFAVSTCISKGFSIKSSPPIFIAMTIFILSEAEEINTIGTSLISRILWHQWNPLKNGSPMSKRTICGAAVLNSSITFLKSTTHDTSYPYVCRCFFNDSAIVRSSSTMNTLYIFSTFTILLNRTKQSCFVLFFYKKYL